MPVYIPPQSMSMHVPPLISQPVSEQPKKILAGITPYCSDSNMFDGLYVAFSGEQIYCVGILLTHIGAKVSQNEFVSELKLE